MSESAKKTILGTPDGEKARDNNPIVVVNNHEMIFKTKKKIQPVMTTPPSLLSCTLPPNGILWQVCINLIQHDAQFKRILPRLEMRKSRSTKNPKKEGYSIWPLTR